MFLILLILAVIVLWILLYILVIRPKLVVFRATAGIYAKLDALEEGWWARMLLWLKGLKVMIVGVVTSAMPLMPVLYDKVAGVDWTTIFPTEEAKVIGVVVAVLGVVGPMLMVVLHNAGLADAAAIEPAK